MNKNSNINIYSSINNINNNNYSKIYSQENSFMKKYRNKKYYHYSLYNSKIQKC